MVLKRLFYLLAVVFVLTGATNFAFAQHEGNEHHEAAEHGHSETKEEKGFNASKVIFSHIADSHYWHLFDWNGHPVSLSLPVIIYHPENGLEMFSASEFHHGEHPYKGKNGNEYRLESGMKEKIVSADGAAIKDFSLTKNVVSMLISVILLLVIMTNVAKKYKKNGVMSAPTGFQNALEPVITFIRDEVAKPNLGNKYMRFMPLLLTIFFFIWINNLLGLLPGGANFTGNIAVTACLALVTFVVMMAVSNKHYWGHLLNPPGVPMGIKFLLVPIEIMSMFIKPIALCIRLFANMMAGHIVILSVISMIFIFGAISSVAGWGFAPVSLAFSMFMFLLELLVAAIQAFIFANLAAVFIGQAIEEPHGDHAH
ncbi:MAG: F0F1 ATP synthase subunit A [Chitinophagales bacterium]|nr:F0F1 ATP synthase subunit A [Chitinophagaceae bacterium]MCB9065557.1 F0F1 ATP synthase subunit A [Chitinophagales bacterium]